LGSPTPPDKFLIPEPYAIILLEKFKMHNICGIKKTIITLSKTSSGMSLTYGPV
jgi:hypothetical protein